MAADSVLLWANTMAARINLVNKTKNLKFDDSGIYWIPECNTYLMLAVGGRGIGKTLSIKRRMIDNFLKHKERFVYIRYMDSELNPTEFFEKIINYYDSELEFGYGGKKPGEPIKLYINGEIAGYMIAIKTAYKAKSIDFIDVTTIHFDEALAPIGSQGIPAHAPTIFIELLETISRNEDDSRTKVFLTANAVALDNEFFDYFHIPVEELQNIKGRKIELNELITFEYCLTTEEFKKKKSETNLGKLMQFTGHWHYAVDNNFVEGVLPEKLKGNEKINYKKNTGYCIKYDDGYLIISHSNFNYKYMAEYLENLPPNLSGGYKKITFELGLSDKIFAFDSGGIAADNQRIKIYDALTSSDIRFDGQRAFTKCLNWFRLTTKW